MADYEKKEMATSHTVDGGEEGVLSDHDKSELRADLPAESQTLERYIERISAIFFNMMTLCCWEVVAVTFQFSLANGGPASMVYGSILVMFGGTCLALSFAEMASIDPTVGAQYRWTADFAPRAKRFWGLLQGWITVTAWTIAVANCTNTIAYVITSIIIFYNDSYVPHRWHVTLLMWATAIPAFVCNLYFRNIQSPFLAIAAFLHVAFFIISIVVLLVMGEPSSNSYVWTTLTYDTNGWSNKGVCFGIGLLTVSFPLSGLDGVLHMSDEVKNVRSRVPQSIIVAVVSNAVMMFAFVLVLLYRIGDVEKVINTPTGLPILEVFYEATGSKAFTTIIALIPAYTSFVALFNVLASVSRLMWQFAKDNGLPFSRQLAYIHPTLHIPLNALGVVTVCMILISIIYIGSSTAFLAIVSLTGIAFNVSYCPPVFFMLWRRLSSHPPEFGEFRLGKWGAPINAVTLVYLVYIITWMPFPPIVPVTWELMNYAGPVFALVIAGALLDWSINGRKRFNMPVKPL